MLRKYFVKDINEYPVLEKKSEMKLDNEGRRESTIGDLHSNALKLLQFLIQDGIITMSEDDFKRFVSIYNMDNDKLDKKTLEEFNAILNAIEVTDKPLTLRLIGDEVADRGSNDYFILTLLAKLRQHKNIELEILFSNHGNEFMRMVLEKKEELSNPGMIEDQFVSMYKWLELIKKGHIDEQEKTSLLDIYKPLLKLMSYTLPSSKNPKMIIYSHAPLKDPIEMINGLAKELGIDGLLAKESYSSAEIASAIDRINAAFQIEIRSHTFCDLYQEKNPIDHLAWGRVNPRGGEIGFYDWQYNKEIREKCNIMTVHGHDRSKELPCNIGLDDDNNLGKLKGRRGDLNLDSGNFYFLESFASPQLVLSNTAAVSTQSSLESKESSSLPQSHGRLKRAKALGSLSFLSYLNSSSSTQQVVDETLPAPPAQEDLVLESRKRKREK